MVHASVQAARHQAAAKAPRSRLRAPTHAGTRRRPHAGQTKQARPPTLNPGGSSRRQLIATCAASDATAGALSASGATSSRTTRGASGASGGCSDA